MPEHLCRYVDTWVERHPSWEFKRWNYHNLPKLQNQDLFDRAEEIAGGGCFQLMSDILRYEILNSEGGVYVDCDFECRHEIDDLVRGAKPGFAAWEVQGTWLANGLMGSVPAHPLLGKLMEELPESVDQRQPGARPNAYSGPQFFTPRALAHASIMTFFPQQWFMPYAYNELHRENEEFKGCYAVHHWNNQRRMRRERGAA